MVYSAPNAVTLGLGWEIEWHIHSVHYAGYWSWISEFFPLLKAAEPLGYLDQWPDNSGLQFKERDERGMVGMTGVTWVFSELENPTNWGCDIGSAIGSPLRDVAPALTGVEAMKNSLSFILVSKGIMQRRPRIKRNPEISLWNLPRLPLSKRVTESVFNRKTILDPFAVANNTVSQTGLLIKK